MLQKKFEATVTLVSKLTLAMGALALTLMALHVTLDIVLRVVLGSSFPGTIEVVSFYYMVCAVFLPLAYVELQGEHICVDVLTSRLPGSLQLILYLLSCLLGLLYFSMLGYQSLLDSIRATSRLETAMANFTFYIWPSRWALTLGFAAILLAICANMLKAITLRKAL
ncbi:MAG: TRAP transporter small permease [Candidatus Competibacteraceae bacterium]|nr:TRAP transporter small permease [Candidatus Competibacteraceae bacterium]MCB1809742.1 TRAP transporter small permease [Candidatus Competibacteraceae bacterium]